MTQADTAQETSRPEQLIIGLCLGVVAISVLFAVFARFWYVGHVPLNSDEAVTGLMGIAATHGHFTAFFWGQNYGGLESLLLAPVFALVGPSNASLYVTMALLSLAAAFLVWRSARRLLSSPILALGLGALVAFFPTATLLDLAQPYGFRTTAYFLSYALLFLAIVIYESPKIRWRWALAGLVAGLGWWASPEIAYVGMAAALILLGVLWRMRAWKQVASAVALTLGAFVLGSLPWFWAWTVNGGNPLHSANLAPVSFQGRVSIFFSHILPQLFGLQQYNTGHGLLIAAGGRSHALGVAVLVLALSASAFSGLRKVGPRRCLAIAALLSPLAYATSPASWYWEDLRYGIYLLPLYALLLALGLEDLMAWRRLRLARPISNLLVISLTMIVLLASLTWSIGQLNYWKSHYSGTGAGWFSAWDSGDAGMKKTAAELEAQGFTVGWADYWTAYRLDFDAKNKLKFSPMPNQQVRNYKTCNEVLHSSQVVWLVTGAAAPSGKQPAHSASAPGGQTWRGLRTRFKDIGMPWTATLTGYDSKSHFHNGKFKINHLGGIWVIATSGPVTPAQIGLSGGLPKAC